MLFNNVLDSEVDFAFCQKKTINEIVYQANVHNDCNMLRAIYIYAYIFIICFWCFNKLGTTAFEGGDS